jgi:ketosteroid isomerase-like protein
MHRWVYVFGLGAMLSGACGTAVNVEQERMALLQRDREWSQAASDIDKFMSYLAPDASVYQTGAPVVKGTDAIRAMHASMLAMPGFSIQWAPVTAEVSSAGDVAYTTGGYDAKMGGVSEKGKYVTTWRKIGGAWKVTTDIFNADGPMATQHAITPVNTLKWGDAPPGLPSGARAAIVSGDPSLPAPFVIRLQVPSGYRIPPHWHPATENVTVLAGTIALGMGDTFDVKTMKDLPVGGYATMPAEMRHFFMAKTAATVQVHGIGPFGITYVNAADDPRKK